MSLVLSVAISGLLAVASAWHPSLSPPKQVFTPFFNLEVAKSSNHSLIGQYVAADAWKLTPNHTEAGIFYQAGPNYTAPLHETGGPVLVRNSTDGQNQIAGTSDCVTCDYQPNSSQYYPEGIFSFTQDGWDNFYGGGWILDFHIDEITHAAKFNLTEDHSIDGWTKLNYCSFTDITGFVTVFLAVWNQYDTKQLPDGGYCDEVHLIWRFYDF